MVTETLNLSKFDPVVWGIKGADLLQKSQINNLSSSVFNYIKSN